MHKENTHEPRTFPKSLKVTPQVIESLRHAGASENSIGDAQHSRYLVRCMGSWAAKGCLGPMLTAAQVHVFERRLSAHLDGRIG